MENLDELKHETKKQVEQRWEQLLFDEVHEIGQRLDLSKGLNLKQESMKLPGDIDRVGALQVHILFKVKSMQMKHDLRCAELRVGIVERLGKATEKAIEAELLRIEEIQKLKVKLNKYSVLSEQLEWTYRALKQKGHALYEALRKQEDGQLY